LIILVLYLKEKRFIVDARFIFNIKQPCKNRGLSFENNGDGSVTIDGKRFETMGDCEDYIEQFPRING